MSEEVPPERGDDGGVSVWRVFALVAYAFLASYVLQKLGWLPWLGFIFWPAVLLTPVVFCLARWRAHAPQFAGYLSAALVAALFGYALAFIPEIPSNQRMLIPGQIAGLVSYSVPVLVLVTTIVVWLINSRRPANTSATFYFGAAWLMLVGVILLAESYVFGFSAKACGDLGWGVYGIMISPLFLASKPYAVGLTMGGTAAFLVGGTLPRVFRVTPGRAILLFVILATVVATVGYVATPVSHEPCSAL